jgi:ABC-type sugar transport system ATPase subunit
MTSRVFTAQHLTKIYSAGEVKVHALRGIDLEVWAAEVVVLLGPSGSGKSTLLNILGGLDQATSGHLFFKDLELTGLDDRPLTAYRRQHVGFVFQFYNLMPSLTAYENVALVTEIAEHPMPPDEALALDHHKPGGWSQAGGDPEGGGRHGQQSSPCPGSRAKSVAGQRFSAARQSFSKRRRSLSASPPSQSSETRGAVPPWRSWHWSNWAPK